MSESRTSAAKNATASRFPRAALDALRTDPAGKVLQRAQWLDAIDRLLRPKLPSELRLHVRLSNIRERTLVYLVDAPIWHAKLRLAATDVVASAQAEGLEVTALNVRVSPQPLWPTPPRSTPPANAVSKAERIAVAEALALLSQEDPPPAASGLRAIRQKAG